MSKAEKTHIVVILLIVFIVGVILCVFLGAGLFLTGDVQKGAVATGPRAVTTKVGVMVPKTTANPIKVVACKELSKGIYQVTIEDSWKGKGLKSYSFLRLQDGILDCPISVVQKENLSGQVRPSSAKLTTVLRLGPVPAKYPLASAVRIVATIQYVDSTGTTTGGRFLL